MHGSAAYEENEDLRGNKNMVAINSDNKQAQRFVKGVICPMCETHLPYPTIVTQDTDRYGRHLRTYFGWCFECGFGCETIQFERDGLWLIYKYQNYRLNEDGRHCQLSDGWTIVNDLPEPAPVVIGPGGDYDIEISLAKPLIDSMQQAANAMSRAMECLLKMMLNKKMP